MEIQNKLNVDETIDESHNRYLTFITAGQLFGLPIKEIVQITQRQEIIPLPEQSHYIKGMINLRGQIIPVIDMRLRFGKQEVDFTDRTCIIITHIQENNFGFIVDEVDEVVDIDKELISSLPTVNAEHQSVSDYLTGVARLKSSEDQKERIIMLLHVEKLLKENEPFVLSQTAENCECTDKDVLSI